MPGKFSITWIPPPNDAFFTLKKYVGSVVASPVRGSISVDGMKPSRVITGPPAPPESETLETTVRLATYSTSGSRLRTTDDGRTGSGAIACTVAGDVVR